MTRLSPIDGWPRSRTTSNGKCATTTSALWMNHTKGQFRRRPTRHPHADPSHGHNRAASILHAPCSCRSVARWLRGVSFAPTLGFYGSWHGPRTTVMAVVTSTSDVGTARTSSWISVSRPEPEHQRSPHRVPNTGTEPECRAITYLSGVRTQPHI
jgi:hypothetical protein